MQIKHLRIILTEEVQNSDKVFFNTNKLSHYDLVILSKHTVGRYKERNMVLPFT